MIGHPQGASGAAGVVATALALSRGFLPPTINLDRPRSGTAIWTSSRTRAARRRPRRRSATASGSDRRTARSSSARDADAMTLDDDVDCGRGPGRRAGGDHPRARAALRVRVFDRARFPAPQAVRRHAEPRRARACSRRHVDVASLRRAERSDRRHAADRARAACACAASTATACAGRSITRERARRVAGRARRRGRRAARGRDHGGRRPIVDADGTVRGCAGPPALGTRRPAYASRARLVIAADGRRSRLAIGRGLSRSRTRPRRWAIGAYFDGVDGRLDARRDARAPRPLHRRGADAGRPEPMRASWCRRHPVDWRWREPGAMLDVATCRRDPELAAAIRAARGWRRRRSMLGPMAVDAPAAGEPGLLLAGDAAGFIDPMTGDGLRFALRARSWPRRRDRRRARRTGCSIGQRALGSCAGRRAIVSGEVAIQSGLRALVGSSPAVRASRATARASGRSRLRAHHSLRRRLPRLPERLMSAASCRRARHADRHPADHGWRSGAVRVQRSGCCARAARSSRPAT